MLITWLLWPVLIYREVYDMDVKGLAQKYYPRLWDIDRLKALVAAGKLSEADYKEITGKSYATR